MVRRMWLICFLISAYKVSVSREKKQVYLVFSEAPPNFCFRYKANVSVSREKKQSLLGFSLPIHYFCAKFDYSL